MLKFEVGKKYCCNSFVKVENYIVTVVDRTDNSVTLSFGIDQESGIDIVLTYNIEVIADIEMILIEQCRNEGNYLSAENIYEENITIKNLRKQTGMSQSKFASYFGISVRSLQGWEQGRKKPPHYLCGLLKRILENECPNEIN